MDDIFLGKTTNVSDYVTSGYTIAKIIENKASLISDNLIPDGEFETGISNFSSADNGVLSYNSDKNLVITGSGGTGSATISSVTLEVSTEYIFEIALAGGTDNDSIQFRLDESALGSTSYGNIYSVASQGTNSSPKKVSLKFKSDSSATGFFLKITNINDTKTAIISSVKLFKASGYGASIGATTTTSVYGGNAPVLPRAIDIAESFADAIGDGSASFNGDADHIELGSITSSNALSLSGSAGSISAWIYLPDVSDGDDHKRIIDKSDAGSGGKGYTITVHTDGSIGAYMAGGNTVTSDAGEITDAEWFHVVWKWDGTNHKLYKNGIEIKSASSSTTPPSNTANMAIGSWNHDVAREWKGNISQIGLWRGALSQAQIQSVMESTSYAKIPASVKSNLGSEMITNGTFDSDTSSWTAINAGNISHVPATGRVKVVNPSNAYIQQTLSAEAGKLYKVSFDHHVLTGSSSSITVILNDAFTLSASSSKIGNTYTAYVSPSSNASNIRIGSYLAGDSWEFDNITLKEVTNDLVGYWGLDSTENNLNVKNVTPNSLGENLGDEEFRGSYAPKPYLGSDWEITGGSASVTEDSSTRYVTFITTVAEYYSENQHRGGKIEFTSANAGMLTGSAVANQIYKIVISGYMSETNSQSVASYPSIYAGAYQYESADVWTTEETTKTYYFTASHASNDTFYPSYNMKAGQQFTLTGISVKKVNGNYGSLI